MVCSKTSEFPQPKPCPCNLVEVSPQWLPLENQFLSTGSMWPEAETCWALCGKNEVLEWENRIWGAGGEEAGPGTVWQKCCLPEMHQGGKMVLGDISGPWGAKAAPDREKSRTGPFTRLRT